MPDMRPIEQLDKSIVLSVADEQRCHTCVLRMARALTAHPC